MLRIGARRLKAEAYLLSTQNVIHVILEPGVPRLSSSFIDHEFEKSWGRPGNFCWVATIMLRSTLDVFAVFFLFLASGKGQGKPRVVEWCNYSFIR